MPRVASTSFCRSQARPNVLRGKAQGHAPLERAPAISPDRLGCARRRSEMEVDAALDLLHIQIDRRRVAPERHIL